MRPTQKFFPPKGYVPMVRGYARVSHSKQFEKNNSIPAQEERIKLYYEMRVKDEESDLAKAIYDRVYAEPNAQSAFSKPFKQRPVGKLLYQQMQPGDHLIIDKIDRLWRDQHDFMVTIRHFQERGIRLHVVNFLGSSIDADSTAGWLLLSQVVLFSELESLTKSDRVRAARSRMRAQGLHDGAQIPFFLELRGGDRRKKFGGGKKVFFRPWYEEAILLLKLNHDKPSKEIAEIMQAASEAGNWDVKFTEARVNRMVRFLVSWNHSGNPPLGTFRLSDLQAKYEMEVGPCDKYNSEVKRRMRAMEIEARAQLKAQVLKELDDGEDSQGEVRGGDVG